MADTAVGGAAGGAPPGMPPLVARWPPCVHAYRSRTLADMPPSRKKAKMAQPPPTVAVGVAAKGRTFRVDVPADGSAADVHRALEAAEAGLATGEYIVVHEGSLGRGRC